MTVTDLLSPWIISSHTRQPPVAFINTPPALKNLFVTLNNRLLPSITLPVTLNLFQGLFIIVTLNLFGGLPPILGAFYNATTFKMPKQVRHDRSVVTLNNILSRSQPPAAIALCTLVQNLFFLTWHKPRIEKKLCFEAPVEFSPKLLHRNRPVAKTSKILYFLRFITSVCTFALANANA